MAEIKSLLAIILLLSFFHIPKASSKHAGFSLNLIREYSPVSSPSQTNFTFHERYKSYVQASMARASYWTSFNKSTANKTIDPDMIKPPLTQEGLMPVVEMRIGGPHLKVFLIFDTGGTISWTQCESCYKCFPQSTPMFDPRLSRSYRKMSSDDVNCKPPRYTKTGRQCTYKREYLQGSYTQGIASYDTFSSFDNGLYTYTPTIRFGCSLESDGFRFPQNTIVSGILGMSKDPDSFPSQLRYLGEKSRFSFCLVDVNIAPNAVNKVTFGDDVPNPPREHLQMVPFINHHRFAHAWAIKLLDISVGEERLHLPPGTFAPNPSGGNGGLILDTGATFTYITRNAYVRVRSKVKDSISRRHAHFTKILGQRDLCYRYNRPVRRRLVDFLPTITFHLEGLADLHISVTSVFHINWTDNSFCLGVMEASSEMPNFLGAVQQQNTRFIYDLSQNSLFFHPENCAG